MGSLLKWNLQNKSFNAAVTKKRLKLKLATLYILSQFDILCSFSICLLETFVLRTFTHTYTT